LNYEKLLLLTILVALLFSFIAVPIASAHKGIGRGHTNLLGQAAVKSGVSAGVVRRPLGETKVTQVQIKESSVVKKGDCHGLTASQ
jgi:hypothetical protein